MPYTVKNGVITNPGKFEGEPEFVFHFWELFLEGSADYDDGRYIGFRLSHEDYELYPHLSGFARLELWEDTQGFVNHILLKEGEPR